LGKIGYGYGSEWHLLRYLGRHREELNRRVIKAAGTGTRIDWLDFGYTGMRKQPDAELKGLDFLPGQKYRKVRSAWRTFWPPGGKPNWDAVGWLHRSRGKDLLLVEAKAHVNELESTCQAKSAASRRRITRALEEAKEFLGAREEAVWTKNFYQYANRLTTLYFLNTHGVPSRLVLIYFLGDVFRSGMRGPKQAAVWREALRKQDRYLGIPRSHALKGLIHKLYLPVTG
jgi:hypothetical protein